MDAVTPAQLRVRKVDVHSIEEHPQNARRGDVETIKDSLTTHGQYAPIVVQESTGYVLKGNHTLRAARELEWKTISAVRIDVGDDQAKRILLMDNRSSDLGGYEEGDLLSLLQSLGGDFVGTGYDDGDLDARIAALTPAETQKDSASEDFADWENKDARSIQLTYSIVEHAEICDAFDRIAEREHLQTYSEVVAWLVARDEA